MRSPGSDGFVSSPPFSSHSAPPILPLQHITSVSLANAVLNQASMAVLLDAEENGRVGIGELEGITKMDLSGIDFANITDLSPFYVMDDLTDLWLADTVNLDAADLNLLLDNLETIEGTDIEGMLYMTQADFDAFNTAGSGLLAAWHAEDGHHVVFVPEPTSLLLIILNAAVLLTCVLRR